MNASNERLEFLGDSILGCITADYLYNRFPNEDEGFLTRVRSKLVDTKALSTFAKLLGLSEHILMSRHLQNLDGRNREKTFENAFEAWLGAIYLDCGLDYARQFVLMVFDTLVDWPAVLTDTNFKEQALRYCQHNNCKPPEYTVISVNGPPHNRMFDVSVKISNVTGKGNDSQKKGAEQKAAKEALRQLSQNKNKNI